jgi:DNA invertase Pin-like site-specific DNA recombinase
MLAIFSEFEWEIIVEQVESGIPRAKANGKCLSRPLIGAEAPAAVLAELAGGTSLRTTTKRCSVSLKTVDSASRPAA